MGLGEEVGMWTNLGWKKRSALKSTWGHGRENMAWGSREEKESLNQSGGEKAPEFRDGEYKRTSEVREWGANDPLFLALVPGSMLLPLTRREGMSLGGEKMVWEPLITQLCLIPSHQLQILMTDHLIKFEFYNSLTWGPLFNSGLLQ